MMNRLLVCILTMAMSTMVAGQTVRDLKRAILMTYYGTSEDSARMVAIDVMTECARHAFPTIEVREAYTSKAAANAMKRRKGMERLVFPKAMERLLADGFNEVIVVCCEMIDGNEADYMRHHIERLRDQFFDVKLTTPLLYTVDDCRKVLDVMVSQIRAGADEQAILIGHGRDGAANDVYCLADYILQHEGHENYHVGTISGYPSINEIKKILKACGTKKVVLAPLIIAAAGHATKDIFKTWREEMKGENYQVRLVYSGVMEYSAIREIIVEKIRQAMEEL